MQDTVKVYYKETVNNIYQLGYKITAKTTLEQQRDNRKEFIYMTCQKALGTIVTAGSVVGLTFGIIPLALPAVVGIGMIFTKDHVVMI
jgi:hypothetical protein